MSERSRTSSNSKAAHCRRFRLFRPALRVQPPSRGEDDDLHARAEPGRPGVRSALDQPKSTAQVLVTAFILRTCGGGKLPRPEGLSIEDCVDQLSPDT